MGVESSVTEASRDPKIARLARAGAILVKLLGRTWRISASHNDEIKRLRDAGRPIVFSLWHGELLPLLYHHQGEGVTVLISEHGDGEIIARIAESLGYRTVRGSTSRGAARSLLELAREVEAGHDLAITPDGPRGPAKSVAPGVSVVANRSAAPVIAAAVWAPSAWRLKSWDKFLIPRPFARVSISYSDSLLIEGSDAREAALAADRVGELMQTAERRAREAFG
ncbi:MAG TPA: lysophospholipid acyltransferase family protein [Gemmatimonadaceae bacterium]